LLTLALAGSAVEAADLTKIERTIAKEPAYQSKEVSYCLLVFGPEAKTRIWLVQDGETLFVDRNGNGDLTEDGERVLLKQKDKTYRSFEVGDIHDGSLTHKGLSVTQMLVTEESVGNAKEFARIKGQSGEPWNWWVGISVERPGDDPRPLPKKIDYIINGDGQGWLTFARTPKDAPIIHLNAPWTFGLQDVKQRLTAGRKSNLQIGVGPQGMGPGTLAWVKYPGTIPADAYPVAEITFPPKTPGGKAITQRYILKSRC
jgi:hypothetical protein